jgi:hypothetical protein
MQSTENVTLSGEMRTPTKIQSRKFYQKGQSREPVAEGKTMLTLTLSK